eukprot:gnl/Hemi2/16160_TR5363_c0_g1_i3.p1 gnl/Hemi2/16160_TR5363_c0_g1~~gnl/Hemi2/16160_TR5363_c0_g1_i3.p1  ORF type:complete len:512 (-),score=167.19 gnl/Hemi2/16160_TR5363_c0_g1_i3:116-1651(-)
MGGEGDKRIAVWDCQTGQAITAANMPMPGVNVVKFLATRDDIFVTGGQHGLLFWDVDRALRKMTNEAATLGQLKRVINDIVPAPNDEYIYCGTASGDIFQVLVRTRTLKLTGPNVPFTQGVLTLARTHLPNEILIGGGDGTFAVMKSDTFRVLRTGKAPSGVTSITACGAGSTFFIGTQDSSIFAVQFDSLAPTLTNSCHHGRINSLDFPYEFSGLFVTCAENEIRVWNAGTTAEILRITEPTTKAALLCNCAVVMKDGRSILSGWDDGKVRAYSPQTGRQLFVIHDAHPSGVTAVVGSNDCRFILTGGKDGMVRSWRLGADSQTLLASMKEHRGRINAIRIRNNDLQCVTASDDGTCVIWNIQEGVRASVLAAATFFRAVCYHPDESQLVTTGTDRKITYWDGFDGSAIRIVEASEGELYGLAVSKAGDAIVSGGHDRRVKVWDYESGLCYFVGVGHSLAVTCVSISPDQRYIVSCGEEGGIFKWRMPQMTAPAAATATSQSLGKSASRR